MIPWRSVRRLSASLLLFLVASPLFGCAKEDTHYESVCQLIRRDVVEQDEKGGPKLVDIELEWDPCPGEQYQVVRGGHDFATCTAKYKMGDFVPVTVVHHWDTRGFYTWDLSRVGDCNHIVDWEAEGSFEKSQKCTKAESYGAVNGFVCSRRPTGRLLAVCPWTARD